jgi:urease accessory protein
MKGVNPFMTPLESTHILGNATDAAFINRRRRYVAVGWGDAGKHRQILTTDDGCPLQVQLPRATFLSDGAVLHDDSHTVIVVHRPPEPAITAAFADNPGDDGTRRLLLLGYTLGNQHAPLDVTTTGVATPLMTSPAAAERMLRALHVVGHVTTIALAAHGWSNTSADHHHDAA